MIVLGIVYAMFQVNAWTFATAMTLLIVWSFISYALIEKTGMSVVKKCSLRRGQQII